MDTEIEDLAYLRSWFDEKWICHIKPYIEKNFHQESFNSQRNFMLKHLYFTKKIIENTELENEDKIIEILNELSYGKSKIVLVTGARGSGKTATGMWIFDRLHEKNAWKKFYYVKKEYIPDLPSWINIVSSVDYLPNDCIALLDESALEFSSRRSMTNKNVEFSNKLMILRHKGITLICIAQHSKMAEINLRRLADIKIYKRGADMEKDDNEDINLIRKRLMPYDDEDNLFENLQYHTFYNFINPLPEWWSDSISKSWKFYEKKETKKK